jgi:hypothetical protein
VVMLLLVGVIVVGVHSGRVKVCVSFFAAQFLTVVAAVGP